MDVNETFLKDGYIIVPASTHESILRLRTAIFKKCKTIFDFSGDNVEYFFNNFHQLGIDKGNLNSKRMELINHCTQHIDVSGMIYEAFSPVISQLLGADLLAQKNINIVISEPHDPNNSELHSDAPANSYFEIVIWLPFVDCYGTKTLYILNKQKSKELTASAGKAQPDWEQMKEFAIKNGASVTVPFGSALFFWSGLFHGSVVNTENETRWSLNLRFKNAFTPVGQKDPFGFFKVFRLSPLTKLALAAEKQQLSQ